MIRTPFSLIAYTFLAFGQDAAPPNNQSIDLVLNKQEELRARAAALIAEREAVNSEITKDSFTFEKDRIKSVKDFIQSDLPAFKSRITQFSSPALVKLLDLYKNDAANEIGRLERDLKSKQVARAADIDALRRKINNINLEIAQIEAAHTIVSAEVTRQKAALELESRRNLYDGLHTESSKINGIDKTFGPGTINPKQ